MEPEFYEFFDFVGESMTYGNHVYTIVDVTDNAVVLNVDGSYVLVADVYTKMTSNGYCEIATVNNETIKASYFA